MTLMPLEMAVASLLHTGKFQPWDCVLNLWVLCYNQVREIQMGVYLNPDNNAFRTDVNDEIFVDKSMLISELNAKLGFKGKYFCISRPRRFGKTMAGNMISAYYSRGCDSRSLFSVLEIASTEGFEKNLNGYNVLKLDVNSFYSNAPKTEGGLEYMRRLVLEDFCEEYPDIVTPDMPVSEAILKVYRKTGIPFVVIIDEYDMPIRDPGLKNDIGLYLDFLNGLFKADDISQAISLAYITGILPIMRDKVGSRLNVFGKEHTILSSAGLAPYFGFTDHEVRELCLRHGADYNEIRKWYDGYRVDGYEIYNPQSVCQAISRKDYCSYWTETGSYELVTEYIHSNMYGIVNDIEAMMGNQEIPVKTGYFLNRLDAFSGKDEVFTYLVHIGYLSYNAEARTCFIPNREVRDNWELALGRKNGFENYMKLLDESRSLYDATLDQNERFVSEAVARVHMEVTSNLSYNSEACFRSILYNAYNYARSMYTFSNEFPAGQGYADLVMIPLDKKDPAIIVELKKNRSPEVALAQIKARRYPDGLEHYKDNMLLVGISYDADTKEHSCRIERFQG